MDITNETYLFPYFCYFNLTSKCNLRCKHCFGKYSVQEDSELSKNELSSLIDNLVKSHVFFINISGGEVTQSENFEWFINELSRRGIHFVLTTNGVFSEKIREVILKNKEYLIGLKISLDGPDAQSHCYVRLDSNFKKNKNIFTITINNIFFFKKKGIPITIATVLHIENIKKMEKFRQLIKKINPTSWFISPIIPVGRGKENKNIKEDYNFYGTDFWEILEKENKKEKINTRFIDMPKIEEGSLPAYECPAGLNFCEIHSDGTMSPCTLCRVCIPKNLIKFENIKNKSIQEIWEGEPFKKFRSFMNKGCEGCKNLSKCNKCIPQSFYSFGRGDLPTPFCIKNGNALGLKNLKEYEIKLNEGIKC
jgi:MoaA/NifB/PqqE/SkfB family radical SAM enzyme